MPWTHRAFGIDTPVADLLAGKSVFHALGDYYRAAYSHNPLVLTFFDQFTQEIDNYVPMRALFLTFDPVPYSLFPADRDTFNIAWRRTMRRELNGGYARSLVASAFSRRDPHGRRTLYEDSFPLGLPDVGDDNAFVLETAVDYVGASLRSMPRPFLAYFHFMPPHEPYRTHIEFLNRFRDDGYLPPPKPKDVFRRQHGITAEQMNESRRRYDEYLLYVDREFSRLLESIRADGTLEGTWVILTSDHGELFERRLLGHITPALFQPVIHIPLIIFQPGRGVRLDVHAPTSTIDLLPTLIHIAGGHQAKWVEGHVLPPFEADAGSERSLYAVHSRANAPDEAITTGSLMLLRGLHKLTYYFGYSQLKGQERVELYDIENDPEELHNLAKREASTAKDLLAELKAKLDEVNRPYRREA